jgi:plastocyanin
VSRSVIRITSTTFGLLNLVRRRSSRKKMRRFLILCALLVFATSSFAKEAYLSIGGSVNNFRTDTRIFNPSSSKDIQIQATLLPVGNIDNSSRQSITITVPKRQMLDYDDVVASLFNASGLGAIRLSSSDDFVATQRIYAVTSATACQAVGTLGQFVPGLQTSDATKQGVLIQLKSNSAFRTNIGAVNPNNVTASVTWRLYDKNNALVATGNPVAMPPFAVISPTNIASTFFFNPGSADLSDAWVGFTSDQPIFAYASVIDNVTTDPTFIPMSVDSGVVAQTGSLTFNVLEKNNSITISPVPTSLKIGDVVTFHITVQDSNHGFELTDPDSTVAIPPTTFSPGDTADRTFTVRKNGTYTYFCSNSGCGAHPGMSGTFDVGQGTDPQPHY